MVLDLESLDATIVQFDPDFQVETIKPKAFRPPKGLVKSRPDVPDHFERPAPSLRTAVGFLCYWLRRCPPMAEIMSNPDLALAGIRYRGPNKILTQYGNVFAAFDIGLRICRYWESARTDIAYTPEARQQILKFSIPQKSEYIEDVCYTLAEKNISPHSLNMLYKSLFLGLRP